MKRKLEDLVAIVTGGAMGNGLGIVQIFLKYNAKVIIIDNSPKLETTIKELKEQGWTLDGYNIDIRDYEALKTCCKEIKEKYGHIDILVNNAGVARLDNFLNMDDEKRDFQFDVNIKGTWNMTKAALPYMIENKKGSIVNLSSVTGPLVADSGEVAYATTKAAILGFTKALAMEVVDDNIRVNAIMPGYIMTPMVEGIATETNKDNPIEVIEGIRKGIPMKRLGTIQELGELAAFLASDEASYITGQGIVIDGASTLPETASVGV